MVANHDWFCSQFKVRWLEETLVSWLHLSFIVVVIIMVDVSILYRRQFVKIWLFNASLMTLQLKFMKHMQGLRLLKEIWMNIINLKHNWKNFMIYYLRRRVPWSEYHVLHKNAFQSTCWHVQSTLFGYYIDTTAYENIITCIAFHTAATKTTTYS